MCAHRAGNRSRPRLRLPEAKPPDLNHSVVTGTLIDAPRPGRNPLGEPVTFLRIEFPVADPEHPQLLWTWASCDVEVSEALAEQRGIRELQGGTQVLVAGQLSERWMIRDGRTGKRAAIVAALIHPGLPPECDELIVPACPSGAGRKPG